MKKSQNLKKNDTGLRVLEILKILIKEPTSGEDIINKIEKSQKIENIYTKETILKYFNTLASVGLTVEKNKEDGKYCLKNFPIEIMLEEKELKLLCLLEGYVKSLYQIRMEECFNEFQQNLIRSFSKNTLKLYNSIKETATMKMDVDLIYNESVIRRLEKYCIDAQKLKIGYLNKSSKATEIYTVEPKSIVYDVDNAYLMVYNPKLSRNQKLLVENIIHIVQMPQKVNFVSNPNTVVFELKGRLVKSYKLKESEKIINHTGESLIVSNLLEDKEDLFKRLLKYGENCKILQPTDVKKEFLEFIDKVLNNINGSQSL